MRRSASNDAAREGLPARAADRRPPPAATPVAWTEIERIHSKRVTVRMDRAAGPMDRPFPPTGRFWQS